MTVQRTEAMHAHSAGLDALPQERILEILAKSQVEAASAVENALPAIADAAALAADRFESDGRLVYVGAGSAGVMAMSDALELPGTFGISSERIVILLAGGANGLRDLAGSAEDDRGQAASDIAAANVSSRDCVICVSASGSTPYALEAMKAARELGATTIAVANDENAPLFADADVAVLLPTPPEVIAGSTRMGAGTAQKIALNLFSTLMAIRLGHVHDGYMIGLRADNRKLRERASRIVAAIGGCGEAQATEHLERAGGSVKAAVLMAAGAPDAAAANRILDDAHHRLRPALSLVEQRWNSSQTGA